MTTNVEIVTANATQAQRFTTADIFAAMEIRGYNFSGKVAGAPLRAELHNMPKFTNLYGPMWGGLNDAGEPVIRYEDPTSYDVLSR